ncbi:MAG: DMT family transporter [Silicimonas sp.]|nr:DMT family transporter [Silicimonas sp.]
MQRKDRIDALGAAALVAISMMLAFNQVVIRVVNDGLQPVFFAGVRSAGAVLCLWLWFAVRRRPFGLLRRNAFYGVLMGLFFSLEFILLFTALDLTTVSRATIMLYTMSIWLALAAHVIIPGERITRTKAAGQGLAFVGVVIAIAWRGQGGDASLTGDILALLASFAWAGLALVARTGLKDVAPDRQLLWQVLVSTPVLLIAALFFGPFIRELEPIHLWGLAFQIVVVLALGFAFWLWLLTIYPAASVAAFGFLTPVFGVVLGWLLLDEPIGPPILISLVLVSTGLILINRPPQVPQKV